MMVPANSTGTKILNLALVFGSFASMTEAVHENRDVQRLRSQHFDLILMFPLFSESLLGYSYIFDAPVVLLNTLGSSYETNKYTGNPAPLSYVPNVALHSVTETSFTFRLLNSLASLVFFPLISTFMEYRQQKILQKYFPKAPPLSELTKNVSLVLLNSHVSIEGPRPYVPNMIQIGGFHIQEPKVLVPDIKHYLDEATNGAVLFSLGSNIKINELPKEKVDAICTALGKLDMKVLFKSEIKFKTAKNTRLDMWLPQSDILAHPNVKLFISHGGLLSTTEAVYHGVPILGMPVFGDQESNIAGAVASGYALKLSFDELTEEKLTENINEIVSNPRYRENIELRSSLLRNQPVKPMELAVFWIEHVLKHRGANHLKISGVKLSWYQYMLLDVFAFLAMVALLISAVTYFVTKKIISWLKRLLFGKAEAEAKVKTN